MQFNSIGVRTGLVAGAIFLAIIGVLFAAFSMSEHRQAEATAVKEARALVLMAEAAREQTAKKWDLDVYSPEKIRQRAEAADSQRERREQIMDAIPVVNAWRTAQAKEEEAGFQFKPIRENPRNEDHEASAKEMRAIKHFRQNPNADEFHFYDAETNTVRYFRPVRLGETCMNCHGDPDRAQALWGNSDGTDITGHQMEGKEVGDLHGAFEVILPMDKADARTTASILKGGALSVALLLIGMSGIIWLIQRTVTRPMGKVLTGLYQSVEQGDLTQRLPETGTAECAQLSSSFNRMNTSLASVFRDWRDKTANLAAANQQLTDTADELGQNAQAANQRVEQVSHSAQEVNQVVQDVANNISSVSDSASRSTQTTQQGMQSVEQASQRIGELQESTRQVDRIMETIESIAKQTDLLALNAAIEAANAGDAGKGFAVVADEVRKLAEQTSKATHEVSGIVSELRSESDSSVEAMDTVSTQMKDVLSNIEDTEQNANQIAAAAEELAATMGETTDNLGEISGNVDQVASSVTQIESAARELNGMAQDLESDLKKYQVD